LSQRDQFKHGPDLGGGDGFKLFRCVQPGGGKKRTTVNAEGQSPLLGGCYRSTTDKPAEIFSKEYPTSGGEVGLNRECGDKGPSKEL